jgi:hypothetical protein
MASKLTRQQNVALKTWSPANLKALWAAYLAKNPGAKLPGTGMAPNVGGFSPFAAPERPPPGTYDPSIDAQVRASGRGLGDLQQDTGIANQRGQDDFLTGQGELQRALDRRLADAGTERTRHHSDFEQLLGDIGTARTREGEDYGTSLANLGRRYDQLGTSQAERATAAGFVPGGGALQQALEKRMANQAIDRQPIDTSHTRAGQDFAEREANARNLENRDVADYSSLVGSGGQDGRLQEDFQSQLGLGLSRGNEDRANTLARAGRENDQFGLDASAQRWFQATQAGYDPPGRPANQVGSVTNPYKVVRTPRGSRRLYSTGYLVSR